MAKPIGADQTTQTDLYRLMADAAHDWEYFRDTRGRYVWISPTCERATGYTVLEFHKNPSLIEKIVAPEDRKVVARHLAEELGQPGEGEFDFRIVTREGATRWIGHRCRAVYDGAGRRVGCRASNRDITERKEIESALRATERRLRQLINGAADAALLLGPDGSIVDANREAENCLGYSHDELRLKKVWEIDTELDLPRLAQMFAITPETAPETRHATYRRKDGSTFPAEVRTAHIFEDNRPLMFALARDATERHMAHQALRESEQKYRMMAENVADVVWTMDMNEHFTYMSPLAERLLGHSMDEVKNMALQDLLTPDSYQRAFAAFEERIANDGPGHNNQKTLAMELEHIHKDGSIVLCEVSSLFLRDTTGTPIGYIGVTRDITERKQAEENRELVENRMRQAQKLESLGILAGGIAHDFNNLLMSVLGNACLALDELPKDAPQREHLEEIETAAKRAADLCRQMLAYSGKGRFVVEPLNLNALVEDMANLLRVSLSKKATLKFNFTSDLPAIEADATQIRQVIMNLITNAAEAIGECEGVIAVATGFQHVDSAYLGETYLNEQLNPGTYVYFEVSDTGCGMDKKTVSRIFDPFFTTKFTGRGLGLSAVLGIVRGHKGALKVYSEPGMGTTFKILFPASSRAVVVPEQLEPAAESLANGTILVVDDEASVLRVAAQTLKRIGYGVLTASDGRKAVDVFAREHETISLVLLDLTMPSMRGDEVYGELCRIRPGVRVILSSGYSEEDAVAKFAGKGLAGFIQKPYQARELSEKIRTILLK